VSAVISSNTNVEVFFESYRAAFERLDPAAIADHFAYPAHVTSDGKEIGLIAVRSKREWAAQLERLLEMYRAIGFRSARVHELKVTEMSPRLILANLRWELRDAADGLLYEFQAVYTLADVGAGFRITAIAHDEMPRYREALARRTSPDSRNNANA